MNHWRDNTTIVVCSALLEDEWFIDIVEATTGKIHSEGSYNNMEG